MMSNFLKVKRKENKTKLPKVTLKDDDFLLTKIMLLSREVINKIGKLPYISYQKIFIIPYRIWIIFSLSDSFFSGGRKTL